MLIVEEKREPGARDICELEGDWGLPVANENRFNEVK